MAIYADQGRTDSSFQRESESRAEFYDRVAGPYWDQVREVINEWWSHLPADVQPGFRSRLRDRNSDTNVSSTLWELYLHEMLIGSGCTVEIEQAAGDRGKRPDFLVSHAEGQFVLEAIWTAQRLKGTAYSTLTLSLFDAINAVPSPNFSLAVTINKTGTAKPSEKRLKAGLVRWLEGLDPDEFDGAQDNPAKFSHTWEEGDWSFSFQAILRSLGNRGLSASTIGFYPALPWFGGESDLMHSAVKKKGSRYGDLDLPFVVAVGFAVFFPRNEDVETALYGTTVEYVERGKASTYGRLRDGYWTLPHDHDHGHERVSGVLIVDNPAPWTWATNTPTLWHSASPNSISTPVLPTWDSVRMVDGRIEREPAAAKAHTVIGLPAQWPSGKPFPRTHATPVK
ncbi:hypothetical protein C8D87_1133 [Lentzea atacamensis]|uniref:DUF3396 domain-containing protein n=1 Tax=Lentzea atacamensis TaxID=531938 RepID=A0ABX9DXX7_9PSEU|nr:hypothetical protein [Lentzea atacamensis]RAS59703.1 hypothetical protein C8D87_1133 [Lentzea atacamensis]